MAEHKHARAQAGLFDVSHMGQVFLKASNDGGHEDVARALETIVSGDIIGLQPGQVRYTVLLNDEGGILDDLMVTRPEGEASDGLLYLVVNGSRRNVDLRIMRDKLSDKVDILPANDRALIALQGPKAAEVLCRHAPFLEDKKFMTSTACRIDGIDCLVSRSGYTGEDGFEISLPNQSAETLARALLAHEEVEPIGLGARDSLRLEAGLCLYGQDLTMKISPVEAGLTWTIGKRRKMDKDFPGAEKIMGQVFDGTERKRVGIAPEGRGPARERTKIINTDGKTIGQITSGTFGPTIDGPIAMGYVDTAYAEEGCQVGLVVRGRSRGAVVVSLPFVEHRYYKAGEAPAEEPVVRAIPEIEKWVAKEKAGADVVTLDDERPQAEEVKAEPVEVDIPLSSGANLTADDVMALFEYADEHDDGNKKEQVIDLTAETVEPESAGDVVAESEESTTPEADEDADENKEDQSTDEQAGKEDE